MEINEIIKVVPSILWLFLVITIIVLFYSPLRKSLPNISNLKAMGIELSFLKDSIDGAAKSAENRYTVELSKKSQKWKVEVPHEARETVLKRAIQRLDIFSEAQILWVDDHPENNLSERKMFRRLKAEIDISKSSNEALGILRNASYDLIISDIYRDDDNYMNGIEFLKQFRMKNNFTPVISYIGEFYPDKDIPAHAFGITNRLDELLHLTIDALERRSGTYKQYLD